MLPIRLGRRHPPGLAILEKAPGQRRGPNLLVDGDMEDAGVGAWTAVAAALTKQTTSPAEGARCLRVAASSVPSLPSARQTVLVVGRTYRLTGYARADSSGAYPRIYAGAWVWTGAASTSWQDIDVTFTPTIDTIRFYAYGVGANGDYVEYDGLYLSEE